VRGTLLEIIRLPLLIMGVLKVIWVNWLAL